ncbi:MAG TPA: Na+/H+ antiporter NhaA [Candidatus Binatia bacterium]|nr:Na+/H+ antiporter NhaA [Candidatus Binatia bacterium]
MKRQEHELGDDRASTHPVRLPDELIDRVVEPVTRVLHVESASGVVLLMFTVAALILANSSVSDEFLALWRTPIGFSVGAFKIRYSLRHWINDGLMVLFFFVIGLEVKRELVLGELQDLRLAALPIAGALGGMVMPAALYLMLQWGEAGQGGWGIPMATDIAFVMGCLAVMGSRAPRSLRIFLLSLAIADDVGAILVIAIGYTSELYLSALLWGLLGIGLVMLLQRIGVRSVPLYVLVGVGIWFAFHESGVHATIAGVILGLLTPVRSWISKGRLARFVHTLGEFLQGESWQDARERQALLRDVERATRETLSPLERLETTLHPWVSFVIMPLFAFANAGVPIQLGAFHDAVAIAVMVGLGIGKPLGIVLFCWLAVRSGLAKLSEGVSWGVLAAGGVLAGIGFTMSLFIAGLSLSETLLDAAKIGVLSGSASCAVLGMVLLFQLLPKPIPKA